MNDDQKLRSRLIVSFILILAISFYVAMLFTNIIEGGALRFSLTEAIRLSGEHGFHWEVFILTFVIMLVILTVSSANNKKKEAGQQHPIDKNRKLSEKDNYGNADFEKPWDYRSIAQIRPVDKCYGHILGMLDDYGKKCIDFYPDPNDNTSHMNHHIFALGSSGSGKTFTVGKTYCYQSIKLGHSVIHTDPKGELYEDMADIYRQHGYVVRRLNFNDPKMSDGWDCMKSIREAVDDPSELGIRVNAFAHAVVSQIIADSSDIHYTGSVTLLSAMLYRVVLDPKWGIDKNGNCISEKNIKTIYSELSDPAGIAHLEGLFDADVLEKAGPGINPCKSPWGIYYGTGDRVRGNVRGNLGSGMGLLSTSIIADMLSKDDIDLALPGKERCAYFIQFPIPNDPYKFAIALFFSMLISTLQAEAKKNKNQRLRREVDFFLDEFAQIGKIPAWDQLISTVRSFGINVFMIVQTLQQFKDIYGSAQETITSNCGTWLLLGTNDLMSAKYFSERIGQTTIDVESEALEGWAKVFGPRPGARITRGTGKTNLMNPSELINLPSNTLLIIFMRHNPIWAKAIPNILHPYYIEHKKHPGKPRRESFFYDADNERYNLPTRDEMHEAEDAEIKKYWETHTQFVPPDNIDDAPYSSKSESILEEAIDLMRRDFLTLVFRVKDFLTKKGLIHIRETDIPQADAAEPDSVEEEQPLEFAVDDLDDFFGTARQKSIKSQEEKKQKDGPAENIKEQSPSANKETGKGQTPLPSPADRVSVDKVDDSPTAYQHSGGGKPALMETQFTKKGTEPERY